jgi:hypothetical protein
MDQNARCEQQFEISRWDRWFYDSEPGTITFSDKGVPRVIASVQVVGTTSAKTKSWLWAWANDSVPPKECARIAEVRAFGEAEGLPILTDAYWPDDEYHGWAMTAVTAKIVGALGGYRTPRDSGGYSYYVYTSLELANAARDSTQ